MMTYSLHDNVTAFTTTRNYGRDSSLLCPALGVPEERFARPHQVHGTVVRQVAEEFFALPADIRTMLLDGVDAVIYDVRNACIGISTADCIPVLCYDPVHHCAAAVHAGWRGTVARVVVSAVEQMGLAFGTVPEHLRCVIGPGISLDSFEVGEEVHDAFRQAGFPMEEIAVSREKWHLDIKKCNEMQLLSLGVMPENIEVSDIDTMTDGRFFSARRDGAATGRMLSGIVLR
ncbi:MAG: peptidoglycan editing factor PgeF [Bacteroidales bacterium]|nr:peptidoglycan editing factor PgeF [Bacteroidales bacterium]MCM1146420.1 peptidoglycan editing factor PgeF [Bacteroidales bacterium]MCM1205142.1 peptidoglycan editing factor PgeF [Bacillota bacterium]MCM1509389.1 peptidoglycan editing factor PgeF [Clostridium sp.]